MLGGREQILNLFSQKKVEHTNQTLYNKIPLQPYDIGQGTQNRGAYCRTFQPMPGLRNRNKESHDKTALRNGLSWLFLWPECH